MKAFDMFCPQMLLAKFVANGSNGLGGVGNSKFIIFSQSLSGSWESSHLSFMSLGQTNVGICNTLCFQQNVQEFVETAKLTTLLPQFPVVGKPCELITECSRVLQLKDENV